MNSLAGMQDCLTVNMSHLFTDQSSFATCRGKQLASDTLDVATEQEKTIEGEQQQPQISQ